MKTLGIFKTNADCYISNRKLQKTFGLDVAG